MASMADKRRAAEALAYLNEPSKILAALAYRFGRDERMPSRADIQAILEERRARRAVSHYAARRSA